MADMTYLVKHVEKHGRNELQDPWSVRQMGIYHKSEPDRGDVFVIVNPSIPFQRRLKQIKMGAEPLRAWEPHMAFLSCAMEKWRWYVTDVEREYTCMVSTEAVSRCPSPSLNKIRSRKRKYRMWSKVFQKSKILRTLISISAIRKIFKSSETIPSSCPNFSP